MSIVNINNLAVGYPPAKPLLKNLNLNIVAGQIICLIGKNGSGKSTLMRTLSGAQKPVEGAIEMDGKPLHKLSAGELARSLAIVTTERIAAGHLKAEELVALGRYPYTGPFGKLTAADKEAVRASMHATGSQHLAGMYTYTLSDGQWQRLMISRALAQEPRILLLDEPTSFLDWPGKAETFSLVRKLATEQKIAIILASHDLEMALRVSDSVWLIDNQNSLTEGYPEDLLLSGKLEQAFSLSPGQLWKQEANAINLDISIEADPSVKQLVKQALHREFNGEFTPAGIVRVIESDGEQKIFFDQKGKSVQTFASLSQLVIFLKSL